MTKDAFLAKWWPLALAESAKRAGADLDAVIAQAKREGWPMTPDKYAELRADAARTLDLGFTLATVKVLDLAALLAERDAMAKRVKALEKAIKRECAKFNFPDEDRPELWAALKATP